MLLPVLLEPLLPYRAVAMPDTVVAMIMAIVVTMEAMIMDTVTVVMVDKLKKKSFKSLKNR